MLTTLDIDSKLKYRLAKIHSSCCSKGLPQLDGLLTHDLKNAYNIRTPVNLSINAL